jgi:magnesium transporter
MFQYYTIDKNSIVKIATAEGANWINIAAPFNLAELEKFAIQEDFPFSYLTDCIDLYERSRYEEGLHSKLIVINTPIENIDFDIEDEAEYITIPIGIIKKEDKIITISAANNPVIDSCTNNLQNIIHENCLDNLILNIFEKNVYYFLFYLREINKKISLIEKDLKHSSSNAGLNRLLKIQKSLIYFVNDLRADELVLIKLKRNQFFNSKQDLIKEQIQDIMIEYSQALEMSNVYSSILGNMMSAFGSIISNNLGYVVNRLTSVTIILMVPTLIAGIYGMNIPLPFQEHAHSFTLIVLFSIAITLVFIFVFRHKKWL